MLNITSQHNKLLKRKNNSGHRFAIITNHYFPLIKALAMLIKEYLLNRVFIILIGFFSLLITGCVEKKQQIIIKTKYQQVGYFEGARPDVQQYFVYVDLTSIDNSTALVDLKNIADKLCEKAKWCSVHYWDDLDKTGNTIPMTDAQADSKIAAYTINSYNGHKEFGCHEFGDEGQECA